MQIHMQELKSGYYSRNRALYQNISDIYESTIAELYHVNIHYQYQYSLKGEEKQYISFWTRMGDKTLGGVRLREKKYHFHLGHYNKNSFVGKPKDLAVHV